MSNAQERHGGEDEVVQDIREESLLLERALGGWRGVLDSGAPTMVFVLAYLVAGQRLQPAVLAALACSAIVAVYRLIRRQPITQVAYGMVGVAISAFFAWRTGRAENFFLPGLLINLVYGAGFLISILTRWPLLGVGMGYLTGTGSTWRKEASLRRVYGAASWIWVGIFFGRVLIELPLYWSNAVAALGIVKIILGWPVFLGGAYLTYRMLGPVLRAQRAAAQSRHS